MYYLRLPPWISLKQHENNEIYLKDKGKVKFHLMDPWKIWNSDNGSQQKRKSATRQTSSCKKIEAFVLVILMVMVKVVQRNSINLMVMVMQL